MFDCMDYIGKHGHEQVVFCNDAESGLHAIIAIHNTILGPSLGGTRLWHYENSDDAVWDVLRLSEGMTYKAAVAGLSLGGGKAVILADGKESDPAIRAARFKAFGRFVDGLNGRYITAEDVGTKPDDMLAVRESTKHVVGLPGGSGDPSPMTAFGVLRGIQAMVNTVLGRDNLEGVRVAIQGLGKVGIALAEYLIEEGAKVTGSDVNPESCQKARSMGVKVVSPEAIYDAECDVFSPCALGAIINDSTIQRLHCKIIAGAANNQLEDIDRHSQMLAEAGIAYAVDYVINSGGLINVTSELNSGGYDRDWAHHKTSDIYHTIKRMLSIAEDQGITTQRASQVMAQEALQRKLLVPG